MAKFKTFPHYVVHYKDESAVTILRPEILVLHRPIFLGFAEKGEIGIPHYGDYTELADIHGKATFDSYSDFYKHPTVFLKEALGYQKCFFVRLATIEAKTSSAVLECHVKENVMITQYQKDEFGGRVLDADDNPIPIKVDNVIVKEAGIEITWVLRQLDEDEKATTLQPVTSGGVTKFPIFVITGDSPGAWANKCGIKFWFDYSTVDKSIVDDIGALMFNFAPVEQPYGIDTPLPIRDIFSNPSTEFSFKPGSIDMSTERRITFDDILINDYRGAIPFNFNLYPENVKIIGDKVKAVETTNLDLIDGWMVDIATGMDLKGHPYNHMVVLNEGTTGAIHLDENVIQYMLGGNDGDMSDAALESLTKTWLTGETFPDIRDHARYPITHLYDSGYALDTKKGIIDFLGIRDDVKLIISTQDVNNGINTKAEDQSTGSALRAQFLLHPASTIYGTQVFRGSILQQCGHLLNSTWTKIVPATLDCMIKKCKWQGAIYFKGKPKGLPHSAVEIFRDISWFPNSDDHKQLSWDTGLNYMQYYDMTSYHYPDVRSIYPLETSVLSDDIFTDIMVYLNHIARYQWSVFAGRDENPKLLFGEIENSISADIYSKFGQFVNATVTAYQTDIDKALGYQSTIEIAVYGNLPQRVWNIIIPVRREVIGE